VQVAVYPQITQIPQIKPKFNYFFVFLNLRTSSQSADECFYQDSGFCFIGLRHCLVKFPNRTEFVMNNQRGGIISSLIIIPAAITLMVGFFFLGYYVGKYHGAPAAPGEGVPSLPEVVSKNLPKPEEFTFYKTLTGKENKTVSIELKPKADMETKPEKQTADVSDKSAQPPAQGKGTETGSDKKASRPEPERQSAVKSSPAPEKKAEPSNSAQSSKLRYTVQLSSHQEKHAAEAEMKKMKQNGYAAFIVSSALPGKGTWYRVRLGSFSKKEAAEKLRKEVHAKVGVSPIVVME